MHPFYIHFLFPYSLPTTCDIASFPFIILSRLVLLFSKLVILCSIHSYQSFIMCNRACLLRPVVIWFVVFCICPLICQGLKSTMDSKGCAQYSRCGMSSDLYILEAPHLGPSYNYRRYLDLCLVV